MKQCLSAVLHPTARPGKGTWWWLIFYCLCCTANHMVCLSAAKLSIVQNYTAWWQSHWSAKNLLQVNMWWHIDWELKFQLSVRKVSLTPDYYTNMVGSFSFTVIAARIQLYSRCVYEVCVYDASRNSGVSNSDGQSDIPGVWMEGSSRVEYVCDSC